MITALFTKVLHDENTIGLRKRVVEKLTSDMLLTLSSSTASFTDRTLPPNGDGLRGISMTAVTSAGAGTDGAVSSDPDGLSKSSTHAVKHWKQDG